MGGPENEDEVLHDAAHGHLKVFDKDHEPRSVVAFAKAPAVPRRQRLKVVQSRLRSGLVCRSQADKGRDDSPRRCWDAGTVATGDSNGCRAGGVSMPVRQPCLRRRVETSKGRREKGLAGACAELERRLVVRKRTYRKERPRGWRRGGCRGRADSRLSIRIRGRGPSSRPARHRRLV